LIVDAALARARDLGTNAIAHGCTGMGNDQVRFDLAVKASGDYRIVAPIREIQKAHTRTRAYEQQDLEARGFGVRAKQKAYTINENLLGLTMSGGEIDRWDAPGEGARGWCAPREAWPVEPLRATLRFVQGEAVALDGNAMPGHELLARLNASFAQYGVGRGLYTGDTTIGLKGRIVYEAPGLAALLAAHRALEEAVLSKQQNRFKPEVARKWVELVYEGFFHDPLKTDLEAFLASSQAMVNGEVVLETRGGRVDAVAVASPHILNASGATYAQSADWGVEEAEGFIKLFGMSSTLWAEINRKRGTGTKTTTCSTRSSSTSPRWCPSTPSIPRAASAWAAFSSTCARSCRISAWKSPTTATARCRCSRCGVRPRCCSTCTWTRCRLRPHGARIRSRCA